MTGYYRLGSNLSALAQGAAAGFIALRAGLVSSYDPDGYAAKVRIQPEDTETGWLPLLTLLSGSGWGVCAAPAIGDQALVAFLQGDVNAGFVIGFLFDDQSPPPRVESGEIHLRAKGDAASIVLRANGDIASAGSWVHMGSLHVTEDVTVEADVIVGGDVRAGDEPVSLTTHTHGGVQGGSAHTTAPD